MSSLLRMADAEVDGQPSQLWHPSEYPINAKASLELVSWLWYECALSSNQSIKTRDAQASLAYSTDASTKMTAYRSLSSATRSNDDKD